MMRTNFERWLRLSPCASGEPSPLRRAAFAGSACRRPAPLAAFAGAAVFCALLAITAASIPAEAQPASAPVAAGSTQSAAPFMDELSSRGKRRGGGGYGARYKRGGFGDLSFKSRSSKSSRRSAKSRKSRSTKSRGYGRRGPAYGGNVYVGGGRYSRPTSFRYRSVRSLGYE